MSVTYLILLITVGAALIGVKIYLQEKNRKAEEKEIEKKNHEQIVADRLAEIAKFEEEVAANQQDLAVKIYEPVVKDANREEKPKAKQQDKKVRKPKKYQHRAKGK